MPIFFLPCAVFLHNLPELLRQLAVPADAIAGKVPHILISAVVLASPGLMAWAVNLSSSWTISVPPRQEMNVETAVSKPKFQEQGYAYLPLVWGSTLAFYLYPLLVEGGRLLQVFLQYPLITRQSIALMYLQCSKTCQSKCEI